MPIYEYRCDDCDVVFEALQRLSDEPLDVCRHCGGSARKIISSPAIHFVGSGWYVTDYARKAGEKGANGNNGASAKGGDSGKTDSEKMDSGKTDAGKMDSGKTDSGHRAGKEKAGQKAGAASGAKPSSSVSESRAGSPS